MKRTVIIIFIVYAFGSLSLFPKASHSRARDLGIPFDGNAGPLNAITDVKGVLVGQTTIIRGEGGQAVRTGVTAILPNKTLKPVFAATYSHNGTGEMTGTHFINENGYLLSPIMITGTTSIGTVHTAVIKWSRQAPDIFMTVNLPVVAETWDGFLNDIYGFHVKEGHVFQALDNAKSGPVQEGNVGGGTGMMCHLFKGGIGTASRVLDKNDGGYTVGVLVQANYGGRNDFRVVGVPVGKEIQDLKPHVGKPRKRDGSIIVIVATDAPMMALQLKRITKRVSMGLARNGSIASTSSGDIFIAFSTAEYDDKSSPLTITAKIPKGNRINPIFLATVQATEEAIINAMVAAKTMTGYQGNRVHAIPHDRLKTVLKKYNRLNK